MYIVGFTLTLDIILFGPISNSHANCAVTLGILIRETGERRSVGKTWELASFAIKIMMAQVTGAAVGAFVVVLMREGPDVGTTRICAPAGGNYCNGLEGNALRMILAEIIGTFLNVAFAINTIY